MSQRAQTIILTTAGVLLAILALASDWPDWVIVVIFVVMAGGGYLSGRGRDADGS